MKHTHSAIIQLVAITVVGTVIAFTFNAFSVNGISPMRKTVDVPVVENGMAPAELEAIREITLEEFRAFREGGGVVIDARTREEYEAGHVPGAILLDYYEMGYYLDDVLAMIAPDTEIAFYCTSFTCEDSELLAREFYLLGYRDLLVYRGGMAEWKDAGLEIERGIEE